MDKELECAYYNLARIIQKNQEREAQAVQGYTEQLEAISRLKSILGTTKEQKVENQQDLELLEALEEATKEKIADELNHEQGLLSEYVELTDIKPKED
jgi:hypothetical protein